MMPPRRRPASSATSFSATSIFKASATSFSGRTCITSQINRRCGSLGLHLKRSLYHQIEGSSALRIYISGSNIFSIGRSSSRSSCCISSISSSSSSSSSSKRTRVAADAAMRAHQAAILKGKRDKKQKLSPRRWSRQLMPVNSCLK